MTTIAMRRYAAEIFRLQEEHNHVGLSDLAEHIHASPQAISRMLGRMKEQNFVEHAPYRGVRLTKAGEEIALPAIRRHRLVEVFLVRVMGFGWHEAHDHSDRFELGIDEILEDRIAELTGHPTRCPHGEPIPSKDGIMPVVKDASLIEMGPGKTYSISRVRIHDPEKLEYLGDLGLYPEARIELILLAPFSGPVRIRKGREEIVLSYELASALFVT